MKYESDNCEDDDDCRSHQKKAKKKVVSPRYITIL